MCIVRSIIQINVKWIECMSTNMTTIIHFIYEYTFLIYLILFLGSQWAWLFRLRHPYSSASASWLAGKTAPQKSHSQSDLWWKLPWTPYQLPPHVGHQTPPPRKQGHQMRGCGRALCHPRSNGNFQMRGRAFMQPPRSKVLWTYSWPTSMGASSDCFSSWFMTEYSVKGWLIGVK